MNSFTRSVSVGGGGVVAEILLLPDQIQWGGVVADIFRELVYPIRFSGGEGGSSRNF